MAYLSLILILVFSFVAQANTFDQKLFLTKAQNAPIVIVAKVVENKRAVAFWSGLFPAVQTIRYEVTDVLKGDMEKGEICANHYVVKNSRTADQNEPRLLPSLFREGNQLILLLTVSESKETSDGKSLASPDCNVPTYISPDENYGAVLAEPKLLELTRKSLEK